ncbi:Glycoside hydrolase [Macleaya cordata]|uniref:Glycoside hydrolase n=1 Tax=Macleaya cordata TaxID=56857 RepID=A0A200PMX4_MACCD|nr:Glycoside hydrolase [Macleaya cordata]
MNIQHCVAEPKKPQYRGGIIVNPEFNSGLKGWAVFGQGAIEERISDGGNKFLVVHSRTNPTLGSFSQKLHLEEKKFYAFSAWVQVSEGNEAVSAVFKTEDGRLVHGGTVTAKHGCWSMLKGGISVNISSPAELYFENKNAAVEIWVDNVSLQPFSREQWRSHQDERIEKIRKRKVRFEVTDADGTKLAGVQVSIKQTKSNFPFGCAMTQNILTSTAYQNWFASRFTVTTFGNEMKWYSNEARGQGQENYTTCDAMVSFAKANNISVRGHNIFWDNPKYQPQWVKTLSPEELRKAAARRIDSVVSRYSGQLIGWDVVNENLHFSFFEDMLGKNASAVYYSRAHQLDPKTTMFLNEYNTIEVSSDKRANAENYIQKLRDLQDFPGNEKLPFGIGLQGHFPSGQPNLAYMRASIDLLGSAGFPLWLTEVDVDNDPNQAQYLEEILREGYSNPAVEGIIVWSGPGIDGCGTMCLTDYNYKNTPTGDVVDKLLKEWKSKTLEATTNGDGYLETSLFHGEYDLTVKHPMRNSSRFLRFEVAKEGPEEIIHVGFHE